MRRYHLSWPVIFLSTFLVISVVISGKCLKLIKSELQIRSILLKELQYEEFRNVRIEKRNLDKIREYTSKFLKKNPHYKSFPYMDEIGYLTFSMMFADYDLVKGTVPEVDTFTRGIGRVSSTYVFRELYPYYKAIFSDIVYFPIPYMGKDAEKVSYEDSWFAPRSYGGKRKHEGTDIMAGNNLRGYFPVVSITDGIVEKKGWLEQGGYRIGIRAKSGGYFYYAHLDSYAPDLEVGDTVMAGQLLGFMGDSGYGKEGTRGKFDVHLHVGIYIPSTSIEISVNPYWILRILEHNKTEVMH